jgi:hypothetical protein
VLLAITGFFSTWNSIRVQTPWPISVFCPWNGLDNKRFSLSGMVLQTVDGNNRFSLPGMVLTITGFLYLEWSNRFSLSGMVLAITGYNYTWNGLGNKKFST